MNRFLTLLFTAAIILSCGEASQNLKDELMPNARGDIGEIILVMDSALWENQAGSAIRKTLRAPMQGLPQDEPQFNVNKVNPYGLNSVLKSARNMVFAMTLSDRSRENRAIQGYFTNESLKKIQSDTSLYMTIKRDEFAKGQVILFLFAQNEKKLAEKILANQSQIRNLFETIERDQIKSRLFKSREVELEKKIAEDHPFTINVPFGWELAKNAKNFFWFRHLRADREQNVFVYYEPYTSAEVFDDVLAFRDKVTETNLRDGEKADLYITRQYRPDIIGANIRQTSFKGSYAKEIRGLWKVSDNSGGGPYISYTLVDESAQMIYYIEGYVYSPGTKKKNMIREVDAILSTFETKSIK
ncbi:MAG: DUF4837 family protein [Cyclobacteriaceae bacterium]